MVVFEPLALLAAIFALISVSLWWEVVKVANAHGGDAARVNRKLSLAATSTMIVLALAALAVIAPPLAVAVFKLL